MRIVYVRTTQFRVKRAMNGEKQIPFNMHTYTNTYVHSYTYTCMCTYICMYMLWHEWAVGWTVGRQNENVINKSHFNFLAKKYQNEIHFLRPHCTEAEATPRSLLCLPFWARSLRSFGTLRFVAARSALHVILFSSEVHLRIPSNCKSKKTKKAKKKKSK